MALASIKFITAKSQASAGNTFTEAAQRVIQDIMDNLTAANLKPDKINEVKEIRKVCQKGSMKKVKLTKVDVMIESFNDELYLFDIKTAKTISLNLIYFVHAVFNFR